MSSSPLQQNNLAKMKKVKIMLGIQKKKLRKKKKK